VLDFRQVSLPIDFSRQGAKTPRKKQAEDSPFGGIGSVT